jgi:hypothetical protein
VHGGHALEFNGTIAAQSGIPWHDAAGACARTSPERRHAVPSKSVKKCENQKSENRVKKVVFALLLPLILKGTQHNGLLVHLSKLILMMDQHYNQFYF